MNGAPGGQQQQWDKQNVARAGVGVPPPGMMPIQQHFTGPSSSFLNVFNQPGDYNLSINFNPRGGAAANPNQALGQNKQQTFQQPEYFGNPGAMQKSPPGSTSPVGGTIFRAPMSPMGDRLSQSNYPSSP